jgi:UDP-GlcNAc:undecaprenyl-phosphate GlcNAc-1-phosphate transferase
MLIPVYAGITSFLLSFAFLPFIIKFSKTKRLVSHPGERRIHKRITPSVGGVAIFFGFAIAAAGWSIHQRPSVIFSFLSILLIPFIIGVLDDLISLKPGPKLIAQLVTGSLVFFVLNIRVTSDYGLFGEIDLSLALSYVLTLLTVALITNSLNLIDGIDGLAATLSFLACIFFGSWFLFTHNYQFSILCLALAGGTLAFLFQNWEPSKIFMGDTGSLLIGTLLSIFTIQFLNDNHALPTDHALKFTSSVGAAVTVVIIPLIDTSRIIIIRLSKKISPFVADKRHIHHALVKLDFSHRQVVYILALTHICFIGLAVVLRKANEWYLLTLVIGIATTLCIVLDRIVKSSFMRN